MIPVRLTRKNRKRGEKWCTQHLQLFIKASSIARMSASGIFPHRDKASPVSKLSVISQRGLTTRVLDCKWNHRRNLCVCVCVCLLRQCLTEQSAVGVTFTERRYLWHEAVRFCCTVCYRRARRAMVQISGGTCIQRRTVKVDRERNGRRKPTVIFSGCLEVKTKDDFLCVIWIRKVG